MVSGWSGDWFFSTVKRHRNLWGKKRAAFWLELLPAVLRTGIGFFFFLKAANCKKQPKKSIIWHHNDSIEFSEEFKTSAKKRPDRSNTLLCLCHSSSILFSENEARIWPAGFTDVCWQQRNSPLCTEKIWNCKWRQKSQQIHKGSDLFLKSMLFGQYALCCYHQEKATSFSELYHEWTTKGRRKPVRDSHRREPFTSESELSAPRCSGTKWKRNPVYCSQHLTDATK